MMKYGNPVMASSGYIAQLDESLCVGCGTCVDACPFGMAALHPESGLAIICDLCGGDPACVKRCVTGAIVYEYADAGARAKRERLAVRAGEETPEA